MLPSPLFSFVQWVFLTLLMKIIFGRGITGNMNEPTYDADLRKANNTTSRVTISRASTKQPLHNLTRPPLGKTAEVPPTERANIARGARERKQAPQKYQ